MASSSDGRVASLPAPDNRSDITDDTLSQSDSSYAGSVESEPVPSTCAWRTSEFHDQECSRYFDCPSHLVERSLSDSESSSDEDGAAVVENTGQTHTEPDNEHDTGDDRNPRLEIRSGSSPSSPESGPRVPVYASPTPSDIPAASSADGPSSSQPREASISNINLPERSSSLQSPHPLPSNTSGTPSYSPSAEGPTLPYRSRGSDAHHTPESTLFPSSSGRRPSGPPRNFSDILLPRWQPDSEVTFCPICRTQFSFFVRKHHCRLVVCFPLYSLSLG